MNRIGQLFQRKKEKVLNVYCTAGYPRFDSTMEVIKALQENGADMVELGMPYSDPIADGPVIQDSSTAAIRNGMTVKKLFEQLKGLRQNPAEGGIGDSFPILLMGYMNPVMQYGFEKFCADAAAVGIDGLILPDLPEHEFETEFRPVMLKQGLDFIILVTPETPGERVRKLDGLSSGFLYAVSSSSTTGAGKNIDEVKTYLQKLQILKLKNPVLVGFGIRDRKSFKSACENANGAIIGSAYIQALKKTNNINITTKEFLDSILK